MKTWRRNTAGLLEASAARADDARARTEAAIDALVREHATITFNAVAARAGVTKAYLYAHADLRSRVGALRTTSAASPARRIAELETEVERLRATFTWI
jgi:hypothetical protein